jgi:hypothetical protein
VAGLPAEQASRNGTLLPAAAGERTIAISGTMPVSPASMRTGAALDGQP